MGKLSRTKGATFEREIARAFTEALGVEFKRTAPMQARQGSTEPDVDSDRCKVWWIECKRGKRVNVRAGLRQAAEDAHAGRVPLLVYREDGCKACVCLAPEDYLEMLEQWWIDRGPR